MVVAAGTAQGETQENLGGRVDQVVELIVAVLFRVGRFVIPWSEPVVAGGNQILGRLIAFGQLIAGDLLEDKAFKWFVGIEGPDHVIAIAPCERFGGVALISVGLGVADEVEPVSQLTFAL